MGDGEQAGWRCQGQQGRDQQESAGEARGEEGAGETRDEEGRQQTPLPDPIGRSEESRTDARTRALMDRPIANRRVADRPPGSLATHLAMNA
jgi:hypothetical protein